MFIDTNVFMYAVGRRHALRDPARAFFARQLSEEAEPACTSAEVLQELLHAYVPVARMETLDAALELVESTVKEVWALEPQDVALARSLADERPSMSARDLIHVACCRRRGVKRIKTFDRALAAAFEGG